MHVVYYHRKQGLPGCFSIERLFQDVRRALPPDMNATTVYCSFHQGVLGRLANMIMAVFQQGDINHITGDIHYLDFFLCRRRTILTIHDCVSLERSNGIKHLFFLLFWYWIPVRRCSKVTVISTATRDAVLHYTHCSPSKVIVIPDCVSEEFQPKYKEFNVTKPVILHIGGSPNKNLEREVEALKGIPCHFRVIGRLSEVQIGMLQDSDVEFSVASDLSDAEMVDEYRNCDILLFASTYEGFGLPILEAQATGRPVITSRISSMPEVAGDAACLVDPYDINSIKQGILQVLNDMCYCKALVVKGFENVKRFKAKAISRQYVDLYKEIMAKR